MKKKEKLSTYPKKKITLTLREDLIKKAKITAIQSDTSISAIVNDLLEQWLKTTQDKQRMF